MAAATEALLDQLEREARDNSWRLERAGKLKLGFTGHHYPLGLGHHGIVPGDPRIPFPDGMSEALEGAWPNGQRLTIAWRLANDVGTCEDLLLGKPVDPSRVRKDELQRALEPGLVQLVRPIDILHERDA